MSARREPGVYWVRRGGEWEIVEVHPVDKRGSQWIDAMGWDAGVCTPVEWGPRVLPPGTRPGTCEYIEESLLAVEGVESVLVKGDVQDLRAVVVGGDPSRVRFVACEALPAGIRLHLHHTPSATTEVL